MQPSRDQELCALINQDQIVIIQQKLPVQTSWGQERSKQDNWQRKCVMQKKIRDFNSSFILSLKKINQYFGQSNAYLFPHIFTQLQDILIPLCLLLFWFHVEKHSSRAFKKGQPPLQSPRGNCKDDKIQKTQFCGELRGMEIFYFGEDWKETTHLI